MSRRLVSSVVCLLALCAGLRASGILYDVPSEPDDFIGAWDVNIMADDVHFETPSVIRQIRMPISIAGIQTCRLWVFDSMNSAPIHTQDFENVVATDQFDLHTYVFDMNLQVPRDVYIGFSAQGGGWGVNASDYWSWGTTLRCGVTGTVGMYYFGPVASNQLTSTYSPPDNVSFGSLEILSEPVRATAMAVETGQVSMTFTSLPVYGSNQVERCDTIGGTNWVERGMLPAGEASTGWSESAPETATQFYRVITR